MENNKQYYKTNLSSSSVRNGEKLDLSIFIEPKNKEKRIKFEKNNIFKLDNLVLLIGDLTNNIDKAEFCIEYYKKEKLTKKIFILRKHGSGLNSIITKSYDHIAKITITLEGGIVNIQDNFNGLDVSFKDNNLTDSESTDVKLNFSFSESKELLEISSFTVNSSIIQGDILKYKGDKITFRWELKGKPDEVKLILPEGEKTIEPSIKSYDTNDIVHYGENSYTLSIKKGNNVVNKTVKVLIVENSGFYIKESPKGKNINEDTHIVNICVSNKDTSLFALTAIKVDETFHLNSITCLNESYEDWDDLQLSSNDIKVLTPFRTSPMVCIEDKEKNTYKIFFIGGSANGIYDEYDDYANRVALVEIKEDKISSVSLLSEDKSLDKTWGHTCVVYPYKNKDVICLLGGENEYGDTENGILTSEDGIKWKKEVEPDSPSEHKFSHRCMASAIVTHHQDDKKKEIWYGGGKDNIGGNDFNDLWKYNSNKEWEIISDKNNKPLLLPQRGRLVFGLCYNSFYNEKSNSTGVYTLEKYKEKNNDGKKTFFNEILKGQSDTEFEFNESTEISEKLKTSFTISNPAPVITKTFKKITWILVSSDAGKNGQQFSQLLYWLPKIDTNTKGK